MGLICAARAEAPSLQQALQGRRQEGPGGVDLFIGPEGGWSPAEIELAIAAGLRPVSLGRRILRSETAGVVASALTLAALEESL